MPRAYIAGRDEISVFDFDSDAGTLTRKSEPLSQDSAGSFLALSGDCRFLYSCAKVGAAAFAIQPETGLLQHVNTVECEIPGNCHVTVAYNGTDGVALYAGYGGGGVNVVKIAADGSLAAVEPGSAIKHEGGSKVFARGGVQDDAHAHSCFVDSSGKWVLVSEMGQDKVYVYALDISAGKIEKHATVDAAPGSGPRHLDFHPSGKMVYGINELDCTINAYPFTGEGDVLGAAIHTVSTLPVGFNNHDHENAKAANGEPASGPNRPEQTNATADIHVHPNGRFVYGSNRGHDSIVSFALSDDGSMQLIEHVYSGGKHPRNFGIDPSGKWLLVTNQDSNNVTIFSIDQQSGKLTPVGQEPVNFARCIVFGP